MSQRGFLPDSEGDGPPVEAAGALAAGSSLLEGSTAGRLRLERTAPCERVRESLTREKLHHDVRAARRLAEVRRANDSVMAEPSGGCSSRSARMSSIAKQATKMEAPACSARFVRG